MGWIHLSTQREGLLDCGKRLSHFVLIHVPLPGAVDGLPCGWQIPLIPTRKHTAQPAMLRRNLVEALILSGRCACRDPLPAAAVHLSDWLPRSVRPYSGSRSAVNASASPVQSPTQSEGQPERQVAQHGGPSRPPLPGDSKHAAISDGHWMDRRLPGARRWLQDKSLEWWLRGVQARCKCDRRLAGRRAAVYTIPSSPA